MVGWVHQGERQDEYEQSHWYSADSAPHAWGRAGSVGSEQDPAGRLAGSQARTTATRSLSHVAIASPCRQAGAGNTFSPSALRSRSPRAADRGSTQSPADKGAAVPIDHSNGH